MSPSGPSNDYGKDIAPKFWCSEEDTETSADKQKKEKPKDNGTDNEDSEAKEPAEEKKPSDPRDVNSNFYHKQELNNYLKYKKTTTTEEAKGPEHAWRAVSPQDKESTTHSPRNKEPKAHGRFDASTQRTHRNKRATDAYTPKI